MLPQRKGTLSVLKDLLKRGVNLTSQQDVKFILQCSIIGDDDTQGVAAKSPKLTLTQRFRSEKINSELNPLACHEPWPYQASVFYFVPRYCGYSPSM
jgi:hypothetical protein